MNRDIPSSTLATLRGILVSSLSRENLGPHDLPVHEHTRHRSARKVHFHEGKSRTVTRMRDVGGKRGPFSQGLARSRDPRSSLIRWILKIEGWPSSAWRKRDSSPRTRLRSNLGIQFAPRLPALAMIQIQYGGSGR